MLKTGHLAVDEALGKEGISCPSVLELVGCSGSGKTEFLLNLCAVNLLPLEFEGVFLGGPTSRSSTGTPSRPFQC